MKLKAVVLSLLLPILAHANTESINWSTEAHASLIQSAFASQRPDCLRKIEEGSRWVDKFANQLPARSYMHAMRGSASQPLAEAKSMMANYIQSEFEIADQLLESSTQVTNRTPDDPLAQFTHDHRLILNMNDYLESCLHQGKGLHPVMDSTSPAHAGFAIWSILDLADLLKHGDFPQSIENERALFRSPDIMKKTVALMVIVQKMYIDLNIRDFRFE